MFARVEKVLVKIIIYRLFEIDRGNYNVCNVE